MNGKRTSHFRRALIVLLLPLLLLAFGGPALAEVVGRLSRVEGAVDVMPGGQLPAVAAREGAQVQKGDFVRTKSGARAEITFNDGSVVKIAQRSRIDVGEYSASHRKLALPRGKVQATVVPAAGGAPRSFEIRTPNAIAGVRGTSFYVYHQANVTGVAVLSGVVQTSSLSAPSRPVTLVAGTATTVTKRSAPTPPRPVTEKELNSHQSDVTPSASQGGAPAGGGEASGESSGTSGSAAPTASAGSASTGSGDATSETGTSSGTASPRSDEVASGGGETGLPTDGPATAPVSTTPSDTGITPPLESLGPPTTFAPTDPTTFTDPRLSPTPDNSPDFTPEPAPVNPPFVLPSTDAWRDSDLPPDPDTTDPGTTDPGTTDPGTTDPGTTDPGTTDPGTTDPGTTDPGTTDPGTTDPGTTDPGTTDPPVFSSQLAGGLMSRDATIDPLSNLLTIVSDPGLALSISGTTPLWSGSAQASLSGAYPTLPLQQPNHYWLGRFFSDSTPTHTTADAGAYFGYFGGMSLDGTGVLDTNLSAIYVDPTGKAGIMQGNIPGTFTAGTVSGTGTLTLTELNAASGLAPASFSADWWNSKTGTTVVEVTGPVLTEALAGDTRDGSEGFLMNADFNFVSMMENRGDVLQLGYLAADPSFGIWSRESFGSYDGTGSQFALISNADWGTLNTDNSFRLENAIQVVSLGSWQEGALTALADGVWGDLENGNIKLLTGTLTGSSNPGTLSFGAVTTGSFIDLSRFLANPTLAAGLGFPTLPGSDSFTLSGASATGSVSLGTLTFYSRNAGDPISVWVAPNVSGSYSGTLEQQNYSLMNGASPSTSTTLGNLRISSTNPATGNSTWLGTINGIGETGSSFRNEFDGVATGTFTGTTFTGSAAGLAHPVTYYSGITGGLVRFSGGLVSSYGSMDGVMGGTTLWESTPLLTSDFQSIGFLTPSQALNVTDYVLSAPIRSFDVPSGLGVTADGGAYHGQLVAGISTIGGAPDSPGITGLINALFVNPTGGAGILLGKVDGFLEPSSNIWRMDGELLPVVLEAATTVTATTLNSAAGVITVDTPFGTGGTSFNGNGIALSGWLPETYSRSYISSSPGWGIGHFGLFAPYGTAPAPGAPWGVNFTITNGSSADFKMIGAMTGQLWDTANGQLRAGTRGAWHDLLALKPTESPITGIFIGETVGTFNPASLQAMTSGIWLETGKFLDLVATNLAELQTLKIPAVDVGRASFSGSTGDFDVTVNDLVFFAPVNGARPEVFATNNITGNNLVAVPIGSAILTQTSGVAVSGISPTFTMNQWDGGNNKWAATLQFTDTTGVVGGHGNVQFMGVAAGTSSGGLPGTFTGTGAGMVR